MKIKTLLGGALLGLTLAMDAGAQVRQPGDYTGMDPGTRAMVQKLEAQRERRLELEQMRANARGENGYNFEMNQVCQAAGRLTDVMVTERDNGWSKEDTGKDITRRAGGLEVETRPNPDHAVDPVKTLTAMDAWTLELVYLNPIMPSQQAQHLTATKFGCDKLNPSPAARQRIAR